MDANLDSEISAFGASARLSMGTCAGLDLKAKALKLAEDGLLGVIANEEAGGLGLDLDYAVPVVESAAVSRLSFPLIDMLSAARILGELNAEIAADVIAGNDIAVTSMVSDFIVQERQDGTKTVTGRAYSVPFANAARWMVAKIGKQDPALIVVDLHQANVEVCPETTLDPANPRFNVSVADVAIPSGCHSVDKSLIDQFEAHHLLLSAVDLAASARATLDLAIEHLSTRRQFGKKLISFQALRHDLARANLTLTNIDRLVEAALEKANPDAALSSFAYASTHCPGIIEMGLQFHGGMGFTQDVAAHLYLRRARSSIGAYGSFEAMSQSFNRMRLSYGERP